MFLVDSSPSSCWGTVRIAGTLNTPLESSLVEEQEILGLGRGLQIVGDQWSMLMIREAFLHARRFNDFKSRLDVSDAVLSRRLHDLVIDGVFDTIEYNQRPLRLEYRLTERGRDLWSVFVAIWLWESRWTRSSIGRHSTLYHDTCGHSISPNLGCGSCGAVGVGHRQTRVQRRPDITFEEANPTRRYRRTRMRPTADSAHLHPHMLDLLGDRWTVSILATTLIGVRRFGDIQRELGISPYLLSERLAGFVENHVLTKVPVSSGGRRQEYRLLPKGLDMMPVFLFINAWSDRWYPDPLGSVLEIGHTTCGRPLVPVWVCNACGDQLERATVRYD